MVIELVTLSIEPGREQAFEATMAEAKALLVNAKGSQSVRLARGVEHPSKYILEIEWDSLDAHIAFTHTDEITRFRAMVGPFFAQRPQLEHFSPLP